MFSFIALTCPVTLLPSIMVALSSSVISRQAPVVMGMEITEPVVAVASIISAFGDVVLIVITPSSIITLVLLTLTFSSTVTVTFLIAPSQPAHIVSVNATVVVVVRETPFTTAFASTIAVPGEVAEVRVVFAKPSAVVVMGEVMLPSVVANVTSTPVATLPYSSVTKAVIEEMSVPFASIILGSAVRTIAGSCLVFISTDFCASVNANVFLAGAVALHDSTYR